MTPGSTDGLDITIDIVRVYVASPRDWGQGKTDEKLTEAAWMENLLTGIHEVWQWAVILYDGGPTGGSRIITEFWKGALGLPVEVYEPEWETCGPSCAGAKDTPIEPHRRPRKDKAHGTADTFCYTADERAMRRLFHPASSKRPHNVIAVVSKFSRVSRLAVELAATVGLPTKPYAPRWHGNEYRCQ